MLLSTTESIELEYSVTVPEGGVWCVLQADRRGGRGRDVGTQVLVDDVRHLLDCRVGPRWTRVPLVHEVVRIHLFRRDELASLSTFCRFQIKKCSLLKRDFITLYLGNNLKLH